MKVTVFSMCYPVLAVVLFLGLPVCVFARGAVSLDDAVTNSAKHLFERLPEGSKIAIYDFDLKDINAKTSPSLNDRIVSDLTTLFSNESRFTLVSRQELDTVKREMDFQLSGAVSDDAVKSLGKKLEADFVITGSVRPANGGYRLYINPVTVETAEVFPSASFTVRENDPDLKNYLESEQESFNISLGGRAGLSLHIWTLSSDVTGNVENPAASFEPTFQTAFHFNDSWAVQAEIALSFDKVSYSGNDPGRGDYSASFESSSLRLPVLARYTFLNLDDFSFAALAGISFNIPLGAVKTQSDLYGESSYRFSTPMGYVVGANVGWQPQQLGRGRLFADLRFSGDFAKTVIHDSAGTLALYLRNTVSISLGYEFDLPPIIFNKK